MADFPTSVKTFTNPLSTDNLDSPSHADQHADANDEITAIETALGASLANIMSAITSTDNAVARYNGALGQVQNSGVLIDDSDNVSGVGTLGISGAATFGDALAISGALTGVADLTATGTATFNDDSNATVVDIDNDGTGHGLYITQDGVLASGKYALYAYSNAAQVNSHLIFGHLDNASSDKNVLELRQDGTGAVARLNAIGGATHLNLIGDPANSSPTDGDLWFDGTNLKMRVGATTYNIDMTAE